MKRKDLIKKLEVAGFCFKEHGGNHDTYKRGSDTEQVPRHTEINEIDHSPATTRHQYGPAGNGSAVPVGAHV